MFLLGLTVFEHPLLKCFMLAQFGQQTRCRRFPFFKLKNDPDAVDPQSGRSQIPTLSPTFPKMEKVANIVITSVRALCCTGAFCMSFFPKQNRLLQSQDFGLDGDWGVYLLLPPQTYYLFFSGRGGEADSHSLAPWLGGWFVGRVAGVFRPSGIQNFGNNKFLQVVLILHAIQMMRIWIPHSTQKQDMQFCTWSKNNAESKDTLHRISNRVKKKMLNKYY